MHLCRGALLTVAAQHAPALVVCALLSACRICGAILCPPFPPPPSLAGGMFRLSLVPLKRRFSSWAHDKNAFLYSCWDAGMVNCPSRSSHACGTDQRGKRYQQWVRLPTVFPDGDYILGYTWWGGSWQQGDYYSCARIRVRGGQLTASHQPAFTRSSRGGKCWSSATKIGQCRREPCFRKMAWRTPAAFDRRKPKRIFRWAVNK